MSNFREIFCTSIPPSKNKFRSKISEPVTGHMGAVPQSRETGEVMTAHAAKAPDLELGYKATWPNADEMVVEGAELEMTGGRVSTGSEVGMEMKDGFDPNPVEQGRPPVAHPRRSSWGRKSGSWEITPDILAMSSEGGNNRLNGESTPATNR